MLIEEELNLTEHIGEYRLTVSFPMTTIANKLIEQLLVSEKKNEIVEELNHYTQFIKFHIMS